MTTIKCGDHFDGIIETVIVTPHRIFIVTSEKVLKIKNKEGRFYSNILNQCAFQNNRLINWTHTANYDKGEYIFETIDLSEKDDEKAKHDIYITQIKYGDDDDEIILYDKAIFTEMSKKKVIYGKVTGYYYHNFCLFIQTKRAEFRFSGYFRGRGGRDYCFVPTIENIGTLIGRNIAEIRYDRFDLIIVDNDGELYTTKHIKCEPDYYKDIDYDVRFI